MYAEAAAKDVTRCVRMIARDARIIVPKARCKAAE